MRRQLFAAIGVLAGLTVLCGIAYPVAATLVGQVAFAHRADGSLVEVDGQVVGSSLLGQTFTGESYFHPRPSAAGEGYDGAASAASQLGPTNPELLDAVAERVAAYREENGLADDVLVPVDAVTTSGSGLDPHISVANARLQTARVAAERGLGDDDVARLVDEHTTPPSLGVLGEEGVNVLELNITLDEVGSRP